MATFDENIQNFNMELGMTPKVSDLENKPQILKDISTYSKVEHSDNFVIVNILKNGDHLLQARYKVQVGDVEPSSVALGLLEGVVVARFATESLTNVDHTLTHSVPKGFDVLLSKYGLAKVSFKGNIVSVPDNITKGNTLLMSGGIDSTYLLFKSLKGNCNAVSLYHGQPSFHIGLWTEKQASETLVQMARDTFNEPIEHSVLRSRWDCTQPREWAKAYRNFLSIIQASIAYPDTKIWLGTNINDVLHDRHPDFIKGFSEITGIKIETPNLYIGRREIMKDLIDLSLNGNHPYLYASTTSCQGTRFLGKKFLFCGSCHSCLQRLPGAEFGSDPRFSNFNKKLHLIPKGLEGSFSNDAYFKRQPSVKTMKSFFEALRTEDSFRDFIPSLQMVEKEWGIPANGFLIEMQLSALTQKALTEADLPRATPGRPIAPAGRRDKLPPSFEDCVRRIAKRKMRNGVPRARAIIEAHQECTGHRKSIEKLLRPLSPESKKRLDEFRRLIAGAKTKKEAVTILERIKSKVKVEQAKAKKKQPLPIGRTDPKVTEAFRELIGDAKTKAEAIAVLERRRVEVAAERAKGKKKPVGVFRGLAARTKGGVRVTLPTATSGTKRILSDKDEVGDKVTPIFTQKLLRKLGKKEAKKFKSFVGRKIQRSEGQQGFWITGRGGGRIFISVSGISGRAGGTVNTKKSLEDVNHFIDTAFTVTAEEKNQLLELFNNPNFTLQQFEAKDYTIYVMPDVYTDILSKATIAEKLQRKAKALGKTGSKKKFKSKCNWVTLKTGKRVCLVPKILGSEEGRDFAATVASNLPKAFQKDVDVIRIRRTPALEFIPLFALAGAVGSVIFNAKVRGVKAGFIAGSAVAMSGRPKKIAGLSKLAFKGKGIGASAREGIKTELYQASADFTNGSVRSFIGPNRPFPSGLFRSSIASAKWGAITGSLTGAVFSISLLGSYEPKNKKLTVYPLNSGGLSSVRSRRALEDTINHEMAHSLFWIGIEGPDKKISSARTAPERNLMDRFITASVQEKGVSAYANSYQTPGLQFDNNIFATENFAEMHMMYRVRKRTKQDAKRWSSAFKRKPKTTKAFRDFLKFHKAT